MIILKEHPILYPHCERCSQKMATWILNNHQFNSMAYLVGQEKLR